MGRDAHKLAGPVCELNDLGFEGRTWTFEKKVVGESYCRVLLDRALATAKWCTRFPSATVRHHSAAASDHSPIVLSWQQETPHLRKKKKRFRYEVMWEDHVEFKQSLTDSWNENRGAGNLHVFRQKLKQVSGHLVRWDRATFGNVRRELQALKMELDRMQSHPLSTGSSHAELKISEKIMELWLSVGDRNNQFFHIRASRRSKRNKIVKLKKLGGQFTVNEQELGEITTETLYTSDGTENMEAVLDRVPVKVSPEMNAMLIAPYTEVEVKEALFQMFPTKSPGPDGFPAHFSSAIGICVVWK
jgi:hypothetical protein